MQHLRHVVHNKSGFKLSTLTLMLLALGANFVPDSREGITDRAISKSVTNYLWLLYCKKKFGSNDACPKFYFKKGPPTSDRRFTLADPTFKPVRGTVEKYERDLLTRAEYIRHRGGSGRCNFPLTLRKQMQVLRNNPELTVKQADKGMGLVVLRRETYRDLVLNHLDEPSRFEILQSGEIDIALADLIDQRDRVLNFSKKLAPRLIPHRAQQYLKYLSQWKWSQIPVFYGLIKVHKPTLAIRPIVTCQKWVTTGVSEICAHELNLLIQEHLPNVVKAPPVLNCDLLKFTARNKHNIKFITADVVGLYPSIPIDHAIDIISQWISDRVNGEYAGMLRLWMKFVFKNALVAFENTTYKQVWGFPMGTPLAPPAANIFMAVIEDYHGLYGKRPLATCFDTPLADFEMFKRYLDDYTIILSGATDGDVRRLTSELNSRLAPYLSVDVIHSDTDMVTLDLYVRKQKGFCNSGKLHIRTYSKPGHRFQLVNWASRIPKATFKSVAISGTKRLARTCSSYEDFVSLRHLFVNRLWFGGTPLPQLQQWTASVNWLVERQKALEFAPAQSDVLTDNATLRSSVPLHLALMHDPITSLAVPPGLMAEIGKSISGYSDNFRERHILCWSKAKTLGSHLRVAAESPSSAVRASNP